MERILLDTDAPNLHAWIILLLLTRCEILLDTDAPNFMLKFCFGIQQMTQIWIKPDSEGYTKCIERPKNRYSELIFPIFLQFNISSK